MTKAESLLRRIRANILFTHSFANVCEVGYDPVAKRVLMRVLNVLPPKHPTVWPDSVIHVGYAAKGTQYEDLVASLTAILSRLEED